MRTLGRSFSIGPACPSLLANQHPEAAASGFGGRQMQRPRRHVVPRYRGYMQSQARQLLGAAGGGHSKRGSGGREELINEFGYDTKHAMHCARLGFQCLELLSTGKLELPIQGEPADWLRSVRYGRVEFDEWWERSLELDAQLEVIGDDESIRPNAGRAKIDKWCINAHHRTWSRAMT